MLIKPILSLNNYIKLRSEISDPVDTPISNRKSEQIGNAIRYNGQVFYASPSGQFIGLNNNEICISSEYALATDEDIRGNWMIGRDDPFIIGTRWDHSWLELPDPYAYYLMDDLNNLIPNVPGIIYQCKLSHDSGMVTDIEFIPLINFRNSTFRDLFEETDTMLSPDVIKLGLEILGVDDLINSFVIDNEVISFDVIGGDIRLIVGSTESNRRLIPITSDVDQSVISELDRMISLLPEPTLDRKDDKIYFDDVNILGTDIPTGTSDPHIYYHEGRTYSTDNLELVQEGDLGDYISLHSILDSTGDHIISENDIISLVITYNTKNYEYIKLNYNSEPIRLDGYHLDIVDLNLNTIAINLKITESFVTIRGLRLDDKQRAIVESDLFGIQINVDSIIIYPLMEEIEEYQIKSCKRIYKVTE